MNWKPGQQKARREMETPFEGVPPHLYTPLRSWLVNALAREGGRLSDVAMHMRLFLVDASFATRLNHFSNSWPTDPERMLDTVEVILERYGADGQSARDLEALLEVANSAYAVNDDHSGLEERIDAGVKEAVSEAISSSTGSSGDHLVAAWNASYGRANDPVKSYSESIKAVEAALAQIVSPQNLKSTLGTMIRDVNAKPSKWSFVITNKDATGVDTVLSMMRILWDGQTSRHGGTTATRSETPEEARAAVHLAASLVQFGTSGAFTAVSPI